MKKLLILLSIFIISCTKTVEKPQVIFQTSIINALLDGYYDGTYSFGELSKKGDFGIGTLNGLDGELVIVDHEIYQIKSDGKVYKVSDDMKTPFATTTFFKADTIFQFNDTLNFKQLTQFLDGILPSSNLFYAIRMDGTFGLVKSRSVPKQSKPYRQLVDIVANQPVFSYSDIKGTLIGFRVPEYAKGINVPGYHFHFISEDKSVGGHLLDCFGLNVKISIDRINNLELALPLDRDFGKSNSGGNRDKELQTVEK